MDAYRTLERRFERLSGLSGAAAILNWDQAVTMPRGANATRGDQLATLSGLMHEMITASDTGALIEAARDEKLDGWQAANLREMTRAHDRATALPVDLVEAITRAANGCEMVWRDARAADDFAALRPHLEEVVKLTRESAAASGARLGLEPYDALLDRFQPGLDRPTVDRLFAPLEAALPAMVDDASSRQRPARVPEGPFPVERQKGLARALMTRIGFDFDHGRLDESTHPFCGGVPGDHRITTRYDEREIVSSLMGVLHETGHALYEAGLPEEWVRQPVGDARGMAVHESQSLLMEMQACRSPEFLGFLAGELATTFGDQPAFEPDNLVRLYTTVKRGPIRVDADELTYPLHIVLRYRLEQALIEGDLQVAELPEAWRSGMRELLGVTPADDRTGVMQDIHWPIGAFGYFPNYTLGAVLAAQLHRAAIAAVPDIQSALREGDFAPLLGWLRRNVHAHASRFEMPELVEAATGAPLGTDAFLAHLERRYLA
ncbi:MAG: carboxypeptidase M32 [Geminicoccaceae bacterium]|nr:carboxypeptidase M32 [Geminicoccaceae bacterium]